MPTCKLCETTIRRGQKKVFSCSGIEPPISDWELCRSCYRDCVSRIFHLYINKVKPKVKKVTPKRKKVKVKKENKKKRKLYKR